MKMATWTGSPPNKSTRSHFALVAGVAIFISVCDMFCTLGGWNGAVIVNAQETGEHIFDLKIEHGAVAGNVKVVRVKQGEMVRLRWRADEPLTLHLHGYDIEKKVTPGKITEFTFKAHATGRFPVNIHGHGKSHGGGHDETALIRVEVYPR